MNLPNKLTLIRIILVPFVLLFMLPWPDLAIFQDWNSFIGQYGLIIAFFIFSAASLTDYYDGKIARDQNLVTNFGKFLDPIADKMLVISVLIALVQINRLNALIAIIVIIREFMVTGIRLMASDKGVVISASNLGKAKTVSQIVAILIMLGEKTISAITAGFIPGSWVSLAADFAMLVAVVLTIISGVDYLKKNFSYLKE